MIYQHLAPLDARLLDAPLDSGPRWLVPALVAAAAASGAILFWALGARLFALLFFAGFVSMLVAAFVVERRAAKVPAAPVIAVPDFPLIGAALALHDEPAVLTDGEGQILVANPAYRERFPGVSSPAMLGEPLAAARLAAWRDGRAGTSLDDGAAVQIERAGVRGDLLLWRFPKPPAPDMMTIAALRIAGDTGERLSAAGVLAALIDTEGRLLAANKLFADRALGASPSPEALRFDSIVDSDNSGHARLRSEGV